MVKEILIYSSLYSYSVADILKQLEDNKGNDIVLRMNTPGGEVYSAYGVIAKFIEHKKGKSIKVDARADSAGAFLCCYAENVECLDVTTFLFHRAAFSSYIETNQEYFTEAMRNSLIKMNEDLRAAMEGKFTAEAWEKTTGVSLDDLFSLDKRIDVEISAQQAKDLGLVSKISIITPEKKAEIEALVTKTTGSFVPKVSTSSYDEINTATQKNPIKMTSDQLKAAHPETYNTIYNAGVTAERDRVGSFLAFNDIDPEAVVKGIKDGSTLSATAQAEFCRKAMNVNSLAAIAGDNAKPLSTKEQPVAGKGGEAAETAEAAAFDAEVNGILGLKRS